MDAYLYASSSGLIWSRLVLQVLGTVGRMIWSTRPGVKTESWAGTVVNPAASTGTVINPQQVHFDLRYKPAARQWWSCGTVPGDGLVERSLNPQVLVVRL